MNIYSTLIDYDFDKKTYVGDLAEKWSASPDGTSFTFNLRKGVKFHNGRELVADDVKFSIDRVRSAELASPLARFLRPVKQVDAPDQYSGNPSTWRYWPTT